MYSALQQHSYHTKATLNGSLAKHHVQQANA
jgi:hypothetical protein